MYVYDMNGVAIISEQDGLKFPLIGETKSFDEATKLVDNFVLPEEEK